MGDRKFVKIAQVMMMLLLIIWSAILASTTTSARPLNNGEAVVGGVALNHDPIPPISSSGCTYVPISKGKCPPSTSIHGQRNQQSCLSTCTLKSQAQLVAAIRPLHGEQVLLKKFIPNLESFQRGPVPPSGHSHFSCIPRSSGRCVLDAMNVAGPLSRSPPPFPAMSFKRSAAAAAASMENKSNN
ncbi:hypothetical protein QUC31_016531 [Theobroma cacao]